MCIYSVTHLKVRSAALFTVDAAVSGHVDLMSWRPFPSRNSELMGLFFPLVRGWELRVECSINRSTIHIIIFLIEGLNRKTINRTSFFSSLNILSENSHLVNVKKRAKALADYPENLRKFCDSLIHHIDN